MKGIRTMVFSYQQKYSVGDTISNMKHWCAEDGDYIDTDLDHTYTYIFTCNNLEGEIIDYDRIESDEDYEALMYARGIDAYCSNEKEIYIDESVQFRILEVGELQDYTEEYGTDTYIQEIKVEMM